MAEIVFRAFARAPHSAPGLFDRLLRDGARGTLQDIVPPNHLYANLARRCGSQAAAQADVLRTQLA